MARPQKMGLDYFPLDVDFLDDDKVRMLQMEHGALGVVVYLRLLSQLYHDKGYFYCLDDGKLALLALRTGCGCTPQKADLIVRSCVKWSLFDDTLFDGCSALTSKGIQRRYLRAIKERARKAVAQGRQIVVDENLWLLNEQETQEESTGYVKVAPNATLPGNNHHSSREQPPLILGRTHKVKKSKGKKNKEEESERADGMTPPGDTPPAADTPLAYGRNGMVKMTQADYLALKERYGQETVDAKIAHMESWMQEKGRRPKNCAAMLGDWLSEDTPATPAGSTGCTGKRTSAHNVPQRQYNAQELDRLVYTDLDRLNE